VGDAVAEGVNEGETLAVPDALCVVDAVEVPDGEVVTLVDDAGVPGHDVPLGDAVAALNALIAALGEPVGDGVPVPEAVRGPLLAGVMGGDAVPLGVPDNAAPADGVLVTVAAADPVPLGDGDEVPVGAPVSEPVALPVGEPVGESVALPVGELVGEFEADGEPVPEMVGVVVCVGIVTLDRLYQSGTHGLFDRAYAVPVLTLHTTVPVAKMETEMSTLFSVVTYVQRGHTAMSCTVPDDSPTAKRWLVPIPA